MMMDNYVPYYYWGQLLCVDTLVLLGGKNSWSIKKKKTAVGASIPSSSLPITPHHHPSIHGYRAAGMPTTRPTRQQPALDVQGSAAKHILLGA